MVRPQISCHRGKSVEVIRHGSTHEIYPGGWGVKGDVTGSFSRDTLETGTPSEDRPVDSREYVGDFRSDSCSLKEVRTWDLWTSELQYTFDGSEWKRGRPRLRVRYGPVETTSRPRPRGLYILRRRTPPCLVTVETLINQENPETRILYSPMTFPETFRKFWEKWKRTDSREPR